MVSSNRQQDSLQRIPHPMLKALAYRNFSLLYTVPKIYSPILFMAALMAFYPWVES